MRKLLLVSITCALVVGAGCGGTNPVPSELELTGQWRGQSIAVWPGPVDESLTDTVVVNFGFDNGRFAYWTDRFVDTLPRYKPPEGMGDYRWIGDTLYFEECQFTTYYQPLRLEGIFLLEFSGVTLELTQNWDLTGSFWIPQHKVVLIKQE